jgi:cyanate permease
MGTSELIVRVGKPVDLDRTLAVHAQCIGVATVLLPSWVERQRRLELERSTPPLAASGQTLQ